MGSAPTVAAIDARALGHYTPLVSEAPPPRLSLGTFVMLGLLLAIALGLTWVRYGPRDSPASLPSPTSGSPDAQALAPPPPGDPPPRPTPTASRGAVRSVVSGAAPPGCPEDEPDERGFVRPSPWEVLALRAQELRDRLPQLSRDASPELRAGLERLSEADPFPTFDALVRAPDRDRDGFDVAVAVALHLGMRALGQERPEEARQLAERAARLAPSDAAPAVLAGLAADRLGLISETRASFARAHRLAPDEPALLLEHARRQLVAGERAEAFAAARAYLEAVPEDQRVRSWTTRVGEQRRMLARTRPHTRAGVTLYYPDGLPEGRPVQILEAVRGAMGEVARLTDTTPREELTVAIYPDADSMRRATCTPGWTGGVFDGVLHLEAGAMARPGESFRRIVRHESTHAQLAMLNARLPTWLNEGLAQHLEGEASAGTRRSWARMVRASLVIPFVSLEGQLIVIDDPGDARLAYHQSLLMVRMLLERGGARALREALAEAVAGRGEDLFERSLPGVDSAALLSFAESAR